jgi:magnesium chelatase subunit I
VIAQTRAVQGLRELAEHAGLAKGATAPAVASALDFVLEGLHAQRKISRSEDHRYGAAETAPWRGGARRDEPSADESAPIPGGSKKKYYN